MRSRVEITVADRRWTGFGLARLARRAAAAVHAELGLVRLFQISLLACDDARIAELNASFRGKPQPTNVLSWPALDLSAEEPGGQPQLLELPDELGDIAIAWETCAREATEQAKPMADHVTHLIVHGTLHLMGYDHHDDADAALMERLEAKVLASLGISDPYLC